MYLKKKKASSLFTSAFACKKQITKVEELSCNTGLDFRQNVNTDMGDFLVNCIHRAEE